MKDCNLAHVSASCLEMNGLYTVRQRWGNTHHAIDDALSSDPLSFGLTR